MTARPFSTERRRWPLITAVALVLLVVMIVAAGCTAPAPDTPVAAPPPPTAAMPMSDKELAEKSIADARIQIEKTDVVIGWFRGNASTRSDVQLPIIITKREIAVSYLSTAEDEIANGNYERARTKAEEAYAKASESYNNATERQRTMFGVGPNCGRDTAPTYFKTVISVILASLFPALLAAFTYSLFKTNIMPGLERFRQYGDCISDVHVFLGAWIIYAFLLLIAVTNHIFNFGKFFHGRIITLAAFWSGLVILSMILSVIVLGLVIGGMIRSYQRLNREESTPAGETPVPSWQNKGNTGEILAVILLLVLVYFAIRFAFTIRTPFFICM